MSIDRVVHKVSYNGVIYNNVSELDQLVDLSKEPTPIIVTPIMEIRLKETITG